MKTILDTKGLLQRVQNDIPFVEEMLDIFRENLPEYYEKIEASILNKDGEALREASHKLKGAIMSMGGVFAITIAFELEQAGKNNDFSNATKVLDKLKLENMQLISAVQNLIKERQ